MIRRYLLVLVCLGLFAYSWGQGSINRTKNWYFGNGAGIDFNTPSPTPVSGPLVTSEGCATLSDENGNLMFYTDGSTVYTRNNIIMTNGTDIGGYSSSAQCVTILPYPGNSDRWYLFVAGLGFQYAIVDMSLGSDGEVISKNDTLPYPIHNTEKVTAVFKENGIDYWVITQENRDSTYYAYLVTCEGVDTTPVISTLGTISAGQGHLKPSLDGSLIVNTTWSRPVIPPFPGVPGLLQTMSFNKYTGQLSNAEVIKQTSHYSSAFAPNDTFFYVTNTGGSIIRYNRYANPIASSQYTIGLDTGSMHLDYRGIQLAPNGKIYISRHRGSSTALSVIHDPNDPFTPDYRWEDFELFPGTEEAYGLNNLSDNIFLGTFELPLYARTDTVTCAGTQVALGIEDSSYGSKYLWSPSASLNNAASSNPIAEPDTSTMYIVKVFNEIGCDTLYDSVYIEVLDVKYGVLQDDTICSGESVALSFSVGSNHHWTPEESLDNAFISNPIATPTKTTTYQVNYINSCDHIDSASSTIVVKNCNVFVPNAIALNSSESTPFVLGDGIEQFEINIYDRYGNHLLQSSDPMSSWNDVRKNSGLEAGVYLSLVKCSFLDGSNISIKTNVTVIL